MFVTNVIRSSLYAANETDVKSRLNHSNVPACGSIGNRITYKTQLEERKFPVITSPQKTFKALNVVVAVTQGMKETSLWPIDNNTQSSNVAILIGEITSRVTQGQNLVHASHACGAQSQMASVLYSEKYFPSELRVV